MKPATPKHETRAAAAAGRRIRTLRNATGWLSLLILIALLLVSSRIRPGYAQSGEEAWSEPLNLSHSGAATEPKLFFDTRGRGHAVWQDSFEGVMYAQRSVDAVWSEPQAVLFPFPVTLKTLKLFPDAGGNVHALWLSNDGNLALKYGRVSENSFREPALWTVPISFGEDVTAFDAVLDKNGRLHLLFLRSEDNSSGEAGIYYLAADPPFFTMGLPRQLFESLYIRGTGVGVANVSIAAGGGGRVYASWDVSSLEQVYFTRSTDRGGSWEPVELLDTRSEQDAIDAVGPSAVLLAGRGDSAFRFWQAGHEGTNCSQFFEVTIDGGDSWSKRQNMSSVIQGCPSSNQILLNGDGEFILMSARPVGVFLQAWDGVRWSDPQLQTPLSAFTNQETFRQVNLGCRKAAFDAAGALHVVGCDSGAGEDVWLLSRPLGVLIDWFPTPTPTVPWSDPNTLVANLPEISGPVLVGDRQGKMHAFWNEVGGDAIRYARWEGDELGAGLAWSSPVTIVTAPGGSAEQPAAAVGPSGRLFVTWSGGAAGGIGFSSADPAGSIIPEKWSAPVLLPAPRSGGASPDILIDPFGTIYVVFAVPVNENRGIYFVRSDDGGGTWSSPFLIFNAEAANWDMVDRPEIAITSDGRLHAIWTRLSIDATSGAEPMSLVYSTSGDGGQSWTVESTITTRPSLSSQILGIGGNSLQRVWSDLTGDRLTLWYQVSHDSGNSWSEIKRISEYGNETEFFDLTLDQAGSAHIVQIRNGIINETGISPVVLQHVAWDGFAWQLVENLELGNIEITALASGIGARGNLGVLYVMQRESGALQLLDTLLFSNRYLDLNVTIPTPVPTNTPAAEELAELTPSPEPSLTPTPALSTQTRDPGLFDQFGEYGGLLIGLVPAVILIIIFLSFGRGRRTNR